MGLIRAAVSATSSAFGDQFKEFVTCPQVANDVIIQRGDVRYGKGNTNPSEGVISQGSAIVVPEGMAMMIVDNGKIVEFSSEPGTYTWDSSSEPSIFATGLGEGIKKTFQTIGTRITYGGQPAKDQRVYYVNIKMIPGNLFGSQQPEVVSDPLYGSVEITYNGEYAIRVDDPIILVHQLIGANPKDTLRFDDIFVVDGMNMLKSKFAQKVSEAIGVIMLRDHVSFNQIQVHKSEITEEMNHILDQEWHDKYGIVVEDVSLRINASEASRKIVQEMDARVAETTRMSQVYAQNGQGAAMAESMKAMQTAAGNESGAMGGVVGVGMVGQVSNNLVAGAAALQTPTSSNGEVSIKYCPNCGAPGKGNFCTQCGTKLN